MWGKFCRARLSRQSGSAWQILKREWQMLVSTGKCLGHLRGKTVLLDTLDIQRLQLRREFVPEATRHHFRHVQFV